MIIMGLDISMRATGVAVVDSNYRLLHQRVLKTDPGQGVSEIDCIDRAHKQVDQLLGIIEAYRPDRFIVEGAAYGVLTAAKSNAGLLHRMSNTACQLWQVTGIIKYAVRRASDSSMVIMSPTTVKKHITGSGKADKKQMLAAVKEKYGVAFTDDNACDAFALCVCHLDGVPGVVK